MWLSEYVNCELCNKKEWEKAIQEQNGHYLCCQCDGLYDDQELEEKIKYCKECKEIEHDCCSLKDNNCPCCNETKEKITEKKEC